MGNFIPSFYGDLYFSCRICSKECGSRAYGSINGLEKVIMYMFESLREQMVGGKNHDFIDQEHIIISNIIKQQSECDFF
jgi:hypothetical protein